MMQVLESWPTKVTPATATATTTTTVTPLGDDRGIVEAVPC